jgi:hypothetical protein
MFDVPGTTVISRAKRKEIAVGSTVPIERATSSFV